MSTESYAQAYVNCPFYHRDDNRCQLTCEGILDGSTLCQNFRRKEDLQTQLRVFCCEYYKKCEIYRMLMEAKY